VAAYDKGQWSLSPAAHQAYTAERMNVRIADLLFVLDRLDALISDLDNPLAGVLDLESVAVAGHSLGGIAASEACKADRRFKACLNFDGLQKGGPFSMEETAIPPLQPFLFLTKEAELHTRLVESFESTTESYWVVIHGALHESFTDGPQLRDLLSPFSPKTDQLMSLIQGYTIAFLDQTLKGQPSEVLSTTADHGRVSVRKFTSAE
jgi:hypothetical protein